MLRYYVPDQPDKKILTNIEDVVKVLNALSKSKLFHFLYYIHHSKHKTAYLKNMSYFFSCGDIPQAKSVRRLKEMGLIKEVREGKQHPVTKRGTYLKKLYIPKNKEEFVEKLVGMYDIILSGMTRVDK